MLASGVLFSKIAGDRRAEAFSKLSPLDVHKRLAHGQNHGFPYGTIEMPMFVMLWA
jgi:hypothetical protein